MRAMKSMKAMKMATVRMKPGEGAMKSMIARKVVKHQGGRHEVMIATFPDEGPTSAEVQSSEIPSNVAEYEHGVTWDEARQKCGGAGRLTDAVHHGRVIERMSDHGTMYFFKKVDPLAHLKDEFGPFVRECAQLIDKAQQRKTLSCQLQDLLEESEAKRWKLEGQVERLQRQQKKRAKNH